MMKTGENVHTYTIMIHYYYAPSGHDAMVINMQTFFINQYCELLIHLLIRVGYCRCEKYPDDEACKSTTLPMLLAVTTFSSFESSESMLGLGDIVLPGLLLAWTARYLLHSSGIHVMFIYSI
jgi:hypothetical protein